MNKKVLMLLFISLTLIMSSAVVAENLTTTEQGEVNGGVYSHAVQKTPYGNQHSGGNLEEVSFNITNQEESNINPQVTSGASVSNDYNTGTVESTQQIKDIQDARVYTMVYVQGTNNRYGALVNITLDGDNDGSYETVLENNRLLQIASSQDGTVYTVNENITRVYSDYLLSYDVANYINSDTLNVRVQTYSGSDMGTADAKIKCVGLLAAYNVDSSDQRYTYWFNTGHAWTNEKTETSFATNGIAMPESATLVQVATSSAKSDVFINGINFDAVEPSGYFSENVWDILDVYDEESNVLLENEATGGLYGASFKTISAALVLTNTESSPLPIVKVDKVKVSSNGGDALVYVTNNIQATLSNEGSPLEDAKLTLNIGEFSQSVDIANLNATAQSYTFNYTTDEKNTYDLSLVIDYLNGTTETIYSDTLDVKYNGYMGKSFTGGENFTTKREYEGFNTLTIIPVHDYQSADWEKVESVIDAGKYGLNDVDKFVDILYYQPYNWDYDYVMNTYQLSINDLDIYPIAQYNDTKGFGNQWDFPSGLLVYNITDYFIADANNTFNITRLGPAKLALYTGYIVAIYENATQPSIIKITEETDLLNTESSGYGTNSSTAISYAIYEDIDTKDLNSAKLCVVSGAANWPDSNIILNEKRYGTMSDNWNNTQQMSFSTYDVDNLIDGQNIITLQSVNDNLVVYGTILTMNYNEPLVNVTDVKATSNSNNLLVYCNNTLTVTLEAEGEHSPVEVTLKIDDDELTQTVDGVADTTTVDFEYIPTTNGTKNVEVIIKYLNDTSISAYTGTITAYYNGYMGKSFTAGENFTTKRVYEGRNTLILEEFDYYNWADTSKAVYDASTLDADKIVDVLYYQGYNWDKYLNFGLTVNGVESPIIANYSDSKGFASYNYPSGVVVFNITDQFEAGESNEIVPTALENNSNILYGGILVIIYANNTDNTVIMINEEADLLNPEASGLTTSDYTIAYSNYEDVPTGNALLYTISAAADKLNASKIIFNGEEYGCLADNYDSTSKLSIVQSQISNLQEGSNLVALQSINDNLFAMGTILVVSNPAPANVVVNKVDVAASKGDLLVETDNTISINISNDGSAVTATLNVIVDDETTSIELSDFTGEDTVDVIYNPATTGEKTVTVELVIDESAETLYEGVLNAYYNGYRGKSFTAGENFTTKRSYSGNNTLIIAPLEFYLSSGWNETSFYYDAVADGITDQSKVVQVLYYQGYNWDKKLNMFIVFENEPVFDYTAHYSDTKGFGTYNYPSGVLVFDVTSQFMANKTNELILVPESENSNVLYGGYLVIIYANNTVMTDIQINEGADLLNPEASGLTSNEYTIAYSNHENVVSGDATLYTISAAADKQDGSKIVVNGQEYGSLADNYNNITKISIVESSIDNIVDGDNLVELASINDNLFAMGTILVVSHQAPANVVVNKVDVAASKGDLLVETDNTISINISNDGSAVTGTLNVIVDDETTSIELSDFTGEDTVDVIYNPATTGEKTVTVELVIDESAETLYEGVLNAYYNGYRGKSFTAGENFTTKRVYEGKNTLILEEFDYYNWADTSKAVYDASTLEADKIVDVLYYQGYNWDKYLNFGLTVNGVESPVIANYSDSKGFGTYNYPSGVVVFNITNQFVAGETNEIVPTALENNSNILYGGILVIIYANNTEMTTIMINEEADLLNPEASGLTTNDYTIAYSNYENVVSGDATLYTISAAADKADASKIIFNGEEYGCLADNYDATSKLSIVKSEITNVQDGSNLVSLHSISDNLFVMGTILVVSNPLEATLKVDTTEFKMGENATISASIYYGNVVASDINKGKVSFKVNGKTLKDANGKVIYAKVINGTATIENYAIPDSWINTETTIQAVYSGSNELARMNSQKVLINIKPEETTITTSDVTAAAGEKVTFTATVKSGGVAINTGKVVFKINGKSIKDEDGKVIYAKVQNGQVSVEYTIPDDMKDKDYTLTAVFLATGYDRLEDTKTLTVTA